MDFILTDLLLAGLGWLYLLLRYRNKRVVEQVLKADYNGSYTNAGQAVFLNLAAYVIIVLSCGMLLALIISLL